MPRPVAPVFLLAMGIVVAVAGCDSPRSIQRQPVGPPPIVVATPATAESASAESPPAPPAVQPGPSSRELADNGGRDLHFSGEVAAALQQGAPDLIVGGWQDGVVSNLVQFSVHATK